MIECEDSISHTQARVTVGSQAGIELKRISPAIGVEGRALICASR